MSKDEERGNAPKPGDWGSLTVPDAEPTPVADVAPDANEPVRIEPKSVKVDKTAGK